MKRICEKCKSPTVVAQRSKIRLTLRCTTCGYKQVKNVIKKGGG